MAWVKWLNLWLFLYMGQTIYKVFILELAWFQSQSPWLSVFTNSSQFCQIHSTSSHKRTNFNFNYTKNNTCVFQIKWCSKQHFLLNIPVVVFSPKNIVYDFNYLQLLVFSPHCFSNFGNSLKWTRLWRRRSQGNWIIPLLRILFYRPHRWSPPLPGMEPPPGTLQPPLAPR